MLIYLLCNNLPKTVSYLKQHTFIIKQFLWVRNMDRAGSSATESPQKATFMVLGLGSHP